MSQVSEPDSRRLQADIDLLAGISDDGPGWTRRVFSDVDREGRERVADMMRAAGLMASIDSAGNVVGVLPGLDGRRPALVTGSHTDTVAGGGRFDGMVGVVGAIEAVRILRESGIKLHHDLRVVDFLGEEPNDFGLSCVGSRALAGSLHAEHLALSNDQGEMLGSAMTSAGADPEAALGVAWSSEDVKAYFELHIEQGPNLEQLGKPLGVVTAIVGIQRLSATFRGRADHAGTMPMGERRDAGCAAAESMLAIERLAVDGAVATVGRLELTPGATNVIPGTARLLAEGRSVDQEWLDQFRVDVDTELHRAGQVRRVGVDIEWLSLEEPTTMAAWASDIVVDSARRLGQPVAHLASYAGHDAVQMARLGPTAMIFVPSLAGRSHCPEEWTEVSDIAVGVQALVESLVLADTADVG